MLDNRMSAPTNMQSQASNKSVSARDDSNFSLKSLKTESLLAKQTDVARTEHDKGIKEQSESHKQEHQIL